MYIRNLLTVQMAILPYQWSVLTKIEDSSTRKTLKGHQYSHWFSFQSFVSRIFVQSGAISACVSSVHDRIHKALARAVRKRCPVEEEGCKLGSPVPIPIRATMPGPMREMSLPLTWTVAPVTR